VPATGRAYATLPSVLAADVLAFVRSSLPPAPARVLEIGAGGGELAAALRDAGYDVLAIDPAGEAPGVVPVALADVAEADGSFAAAVAVVSLHHVEPLADSCARLAALVRPGGTLIVDELDVERLDERAARWWLDRRAEAGEDGHGDPAEVVGHLREHVHPLARLRAHLSPAFALGAPVRGPYLHRWSLPAGLLTAEQELIARGELPATGARLVGTRR
jgi:SAM-dependent methyltransferase